MLAGQLDTDDWTNNDEPAPVFQWCCSIKIERVSKHSVTILGLCVVTSAAWIIRTSPSKGIGLGSPLAACSVYGDLTRSVHTVNNFSSASNYQTHVCLCIWGPYVRLAFVPNMLSSWSKVIIISVLDILPQMRIWHKNKKMYKALIHMHVYECVCACESDFFNRIG